MAKERSGMIFERLTWFGAVEYTDAKGKRQRIEKRAKSKKHADEIATKLSLELRERFGKAAKVKQSTYSKSAGWYARVTFTDESGKRRYVKRRAENRSDAKEKVKQLVREYDDHGERTIEAAQMTFKDLAAYYEKTYLIEPQYIDGRKVAGLRSAYDFKLRLAVLSDHFGKRKLRSITHGDIEGFRAIRLKTPTRHDKQRSIATVNRELSLLRRVLNVAARNGWIIKNPFYGSASLVTPGDEKPRERIITRDEEARLLAACTGLRAHLKPIIICALDTGMRRGEIFKLRWADVDFENRIIIVRAFNTKTMRERQVAVSGRLARELESLYELSIKDPDALVFGIYDNVKKAFGSARNLAGLPDVRFHDLRHTHATRLVSAHMPLSEVGRVLGHTQANTTYRYVNANVETAQRAIAIIDAFNQPAELEESPELVN